MTKDKGLITTYSKAKIEGMEFVRVSNLTDNGELVNITMYLKVAEKYKKVFPQELPYEVVNKLGLEKNYTTMSENEGKQFSSIIESMVDDIVGKNPVIPFHEMELGLILDIPYLVSQSKDINLKYVNFLKINEFSVIEYMGGFPPVELPYLLMTFIERDENFKSETYLVDNNIFVHVEKFKDSYLAMIYELAVEDERLQKAKLTVISSFTLIEKEDKFIFINDESSEFAVKLNDEEFAQFTERFTKNLKLETFND